MGAVALVNLRFFFEVEEVHGCCRRALSCAAWLPGVLAVCVAARSNYSCRRDEFAAIDACNAFSALEGSALAQFSQKPLLASCNTLAEARRSRFQAGQAHLSASAGCTMYRPLRLLAFVALAAPASAFFRKIGGSNQRIELS